MKAAITRASALLLVLAATAVHAAAAMPLTGMHPQLMDFLRLPVAGLEDNLAYGRRLLEQEHLAADDPLAGVLAKAADGASTSPLAADALASVAMKASDGATLTLDGIKMDRAVQLSSGVTEAPSALFDSFADTLYSSLFAEGAAGRPLLSALPDAPYDVLDLLPRKALGKLVSRDVVKLIGYDAPDKFLGQFLERADVTLGSPVPAGCVGPIHSFVVDGGECELMEDDSVECTPPAVKFISTPLWCNLPYREGVEVTGEQWLKEIQFGRERSGEIIPAALYTVAAAVNVTLPDLGVSDKLLAALDASGVRQWSKVASAFVLNHLLRIQRALLAGAAGAHAPHAHKLGGTTAHAPVAAAAPGVGVGVGVGVVAAQVEHARGGVWRALLGRIAADMGLPIRDVADGLAAMNVLPDEAKAQLADVMTAAGGSAMAALVPQPAAGNP